MYIFQKYVCKEEENELLYKLYMCVKIIYVLIV